MKTKIILVSGLAVAVGLAVAIFKQLAPQETAQTNAERVVAPEQGSNPTPSETPTSAPDPLPAERVNSISGSAPPQTTAAVTSQENAPQPVPVRKPKKSIQDPAARIDLSLVGVEAEAERYWVAAINNPDLPPNERKDLIEDLNEDGFSDPKNPGPQDLPLIVSRMRIIEKHMPAAMDKVNADAFAEAYKDLRNMHAKLTQR